MDDEAIANHPIGQNFNKAEVRVPRISSPFIDGEGETLILEGIESALEAGYVPPGYGLIPGEDDFVEWKSSAILNVGRRGSEKILLPKVVWQPRLVRWVQGLHLMTTVLENL